MKSMTGYGYSEFQDERIHCMLEIKSYNNRYLDLFINLPPYLGMLEGDIREFLKQRVVRGRVEVSVRIRELQEDVNIILDEKVVQNYMAVLKRLAVLADLDGRVELADLLGMDGIMKLERNRDAETYWLLIKPRLEEAFGQFDASRKKEGLHTKSDITQLISEIEQGLLTVQTHGGELENKIRENLEQRFSEVLGSEIDENRILAETAVMLVKYSINEEVNRLHGHLEAVRQVLSSWEPQGKKLDFFCQEMNREINTIGSKSFILEINQAVILMKDAVEKLREQLRNIE